jgi:hypothetical protein
MSTGLKLTAIFLLAFMCNGAAVAQEDQEDMGTLVPDEFKENAEGEEEKEKEIPEVITPGVLSSSGRYLGSASTDTSTSVSAAGDEAVTPIGGSVNRINDEECRSVITNSSDKNTYSVSYYVIGTTQSGSQAFKKFFSATLAPQASKENIFSCRKGLNLDFVLSSGKKRN